MTIIHLDLVKALKESKAARQEIEAVARQTLAEMLACDVSQLDGRQLRRARDEILHFKLILATLSPAGIEVVEKMVRETGRVLTSEDLDAATAEIARRVGLRITFA